MASINVPAPPNSTVTDQEISDLVLAAEDERADALGEILSQNSEFISDFMGLLAITPNSHPASHRLMHIAGLVGLFVGMHFKGVHNRRRPHQVCPALRPPVEGPGHSSYPSGHATQAHLIAHCLSLALTSSSSAAAASGLTALAVRIARNREIAGLHYASDTAAGVQLAADILGVLNGPQMPLEANNRSRFANAVFNASLEWA